MTKVGFYCIVLMAIGCQLALATDSSDYGNQPGELQPNLTPQMAEVPEGENDQSHDSPAVLKIKKDFRSHVAPSCVPSRQAGTEVRK